MAAAPPRLVVDPVGSDMTAMPGAVTFTDPKRAPDAETLRFVPRDPFDLDAYDAVYGLVLGRVLSGQWPNAYVWTDECGVALPVNRTPKNGARLVYAGRKMAIGHIGAHTRPVDVNVHVRTDAQIVVIFELSSEDDRKELARNIGLPLPVYEAARARLPSIPPPEPHLAPIKGYLVWNKPARILTPCEPLRLVA